MKHFFFKKITITATLMICIILLLSQNSLLSNSNEASSINTIYSDSSYDVSNATEHENESDLVYNSFPIPQHSTESQKSQLLQEALILTEHLIDCCIGNYVINDSIELQPDDLTSNRIVNFIICNRFYKDNSSHPYSNFGYIDNNYYISIEEANTIAYEFFGINDCEFENEHFYDPEKKSLFLPDGIGGIGRYKFIFKDSISEYLNEDNIVVKSTVICNSGEFVEYPNQVFSQITVTFKVIEDNNDLYLQLKNINHVSP